MLSFAFIYVVILFFILVNDLKRSLEATVINEKIKGIIFLVAQLLLMSVGRLDNNLGGKVKHNVFLNFFRGLNEGFQSFRGVNTLLTTSLLPLGRLYPYTNNLFCILQSFLMNFS